MPTTVIADSPTPVSIRVRNNPVGSQTKALSNENPEYHAVDRTSARFRPTRSENQPPAVAPTNIPMNVADVMKLMVAIVRFQASSSAGAANENE